MASCTQDIRQALSDIVGGDQVFAGDDIAERYRTDLTRKYASKPAFVVRPASTEEVASVVKLAAANRCPVTVIGGQTGTCGAAVPADGGIGVSLERMDRVLELDDLSLTMTVEAGCVLQRAQECAEAAGLLLPLDLGSRGSAMIGGVIGANAGGNRVLRWGMTRDMVIGLEAVLADGVIVSSLTKMLKDNAGYNWKHLLIGSEGTLGIVTRAVLRLRPLPATRQTALIAANDFEDCVRVMRRLEVRLSGRLSSFELMWADFYERVTEAQLGKRPRPLPLGHRFYAVIEAMGGDEASDAAQFEQALVAVMNDGRIADAVIAQSEREREAIWAVREDLRAGLASLQPAVGYDVSMGLKEMVGFVEEVRRTVTAAFPDAQMIFYGHIGDGNLHAVVSVGKLDEEIRYTLDELVYGVVRGVNGSIAAEHGIGVSRARFLPWSRSASELELMRTLKDVLDPFHILNPGKVLDAI